MRSRDLQRDGADRGVINRQHGHRLWPRGNRDLNRANHVAAVIQLRHDPNAPSVSTRRSDPKDAFRALKRHTSDGVYKSLAAEGARTATN